MHKNQILQSTTKILLFIINILLKKNIFFIYSLIELKYTFR